MAERGTNTEVLDVVVMCGDLLRLAVESAEVLPHCAGRLPLGDRPRPTGWRWDSTVRDDR